MESKTIFFVVQISTKVPGCWHLRCLHKKMGCRWPFWGKWRPPKWHFEFWVLKFELLDDFVRRILPTMRWVPSLHQHCDRKICFSNHQKKTNLLKISSLLSKSCAVIPLLKKSIGFTIILKPWPSSPSSSLSPMFGPNHREKFPQFLDQKNRCRSKEDGQTAMALQLGEGGFLCHVVNAKHRQESPTFWLLILISEGTSK